MHFLFTGFSGYAMFWLVLGCTVLSWQPPTLAQVGEDVLIAGPQVGISDPEFDPAGGRFCWIDDEGNVWIGEVSRRSGRFSPRNGKGVLVDTGAVPPKLTRNGPEWAFSSAGAQIVYTKYDSEGRFALGRARFDGTDWIGEVLPGGSNRYLPFGSSDAADAEPRISYAYHFDSESIVQVRNYWRKLDDPASEEVLTGTLFPGRWVPGLRAMLVNKLDAQGISQVHLYNIDTKVYEQLTFDPVSKSASIMWQAPEFNNEYVLFAVAAELRIDVYRKIDGLWQKIHALRPPSAGPYILSPEIFVHNGKSYISMATSTVSGTSEEKLITPSDLWLVGVDPATPLYRQLSAPEVRVRLDPEVFITDKGPYIYFTSISVPGTTSIYRVDTGLGPTQP
ncbi:hypothetical protein [Gloeobacter violaceus]|uniref:Gll0644 protein n=1 Tax=Gloeobacter violaceus (strain ATCC 29082 / PCC 7421) TaxID=251221 RepID=Q7NMX1_GLOVI|nr:hypothetical protein [Gloeobacter violaceus]BAC88585.1 gll0644 [Gloeobacter violaceus PCC 7421]